MNAAFLLLLFTQEPTIEVRPGFIVVEGKMPVKKSAPVKKEAAKGKDPFDLSNVQKQSPSGQRYPITLATSVQPVGGLKTRTPRAATTRMARTITPVLGAGRSGGTLIRCRT